MIELKKNVSWKIGGIINVSWKIKIKKKNFFVNEGVPHVGKGINEFDQLD